MNNEAPALRRGHAAEEARKNFLYALEANDGPTLRQVAWQLWNCADTLPTWACDSLDVPRGSSYAEGVRHVLKA